MKRLVKCLFVPFSMMIATSAFAQAGTNSGGGMGGQTTPTTTMPAPASSTPSSSMGQRNQNTMGSPAGRTTTFPGTLQTQQQKAQDSINRAERKAKKEARKAEKKAEKAKKKADDKAEKADTSGGGTSAVVEKAIAPDQDALA